MRFPYVGLIFGSLLTLSSLSVFANPDAQTNASISQLSAQTAALEAEVHSLQQQLKALKTQTPTKRSTANKTDHKRVQPVSQATIASGSTKLTGKEFLNLMREEEHYLPFDMDVPGESFVSTGPYVGVPIQYAGSNLIINSPSVNTDLQLLGIRKSIIEQLTAREGQNFKEPYHSHLLLSGLVEGQAGYFNRTLTNGNAPNTFTTNSSNIDVTNVSVDFTFLGPSDWTLGFLELSYDNSPPNESTFNSTSHYTVSNSRVFVNKAFITIGDLLRSPFYGTFGQFYVPFGVYSSFMVSSTFTTILARTKARAIELGFQQQQDDAFYGSLYAFRGDSHASNSSKINNGGINFGYKFKTHNILANFGGGLILNIADSGGLQVANNFQQYEKISHGVPAYDLHANLGIGDHIDLIAEFISATKQFSLNDMSFNGHGAKPSAFDIEGTYSFTFYGKPTTIGIGYQKSNQALALQIPLTRYSLVLNTSWWRNTLQSLEIRHDNQYANSDVATDAGRTTTPSEAGMTDNAIIAQFDYYF